MNTIWLYIIFIILTVIGPACGVQSTQSSTETTAATSPPAAATGEAPLLLWEGPALFAEDPAECHRLRVTEDYQVHTGLCSGEQTAIEFAATGAGGLAEMAARFAPFQADLPQGRLTFNGQGEIGGPAWQRALTTWAQFTYAELATGHIGAANRTALAWNLGEQEGRCHILLVLSHGYATAGLSPCTGGQMEVIADDWVDPANWEQFDVWLYNRAPFYQGNSYLDGRGTTEMSSSEAAALAEWANKVYAKLSQTAGVPAQPRPTKEAASVTALTGQTATFPVIAETGLYGFADQTGQVVVKPQYTYADQLIEGRAMIQQGDKWGFLDEQGQEIVPPQYEGGNAYTEGLAGVQTPV